MRTEPSSSHRIVEFGWLTATAVIAVATLQWLSTVSATAPFPRPPRFEPGAELPERSSPRPDVARLASLLDLPAPEEPAARGVPAPRAAPTLVRDDAPGLQVREVETIYEVWESPPSPRQADPARTDWGTPCPLPDARIVPVFREGRAVGFALLRIRPGSWYAKLGFVDGDIIHRVNGSEMTSPEHAFSTYARLNDTGTIVVDLERGGGALRKTYVRHVGQPSRP